MCTVVFWNKLVFLNMIYQNLLNSNKYPLKYLYWISVAKNKHTYILGISILVDPSSATAVLFQRIGCRAVFPKLNSSRFRVSIHWKKKRRAWSTMGVLFSGDLWGHLLCTMMYVCTFKLCLKSRLERPKKWKNRVIFSHARASFVAIC